jgi:iron-sulfur cluster assembly protein
MVTLTENAANEIKRQLTFISGVEASVRIGLEPGGCSGTKYVITPGAKRQPNDLETNQLGVLVLVDPISLTSIEGLKIDFVDALMGGGFQFDNPNAARSCGCGASFKAAEPKTANIA